MPESMEAGWQEIKQHLGLDRSRAAVAAELKRALEAAPLGAMFEPGGLCSGYYPLEPLPDRYFVAQEFRPDRDDLRTALAAALVDFGLQPVCGDDFLWTGPLLCKLSALIHSTPFGVYQLTTSQNPNVYLELGLAMGLGRPFVLVKDQEAVVASLAGGLDYYPLDSYLALRYELGPKVGPFLADIGNYQPQALPGTGSQSTVVIAHGDLDVLDFCLPVARQVAGCGLTPLILGDPTGRLAHYLEREGIPARLVGQAGRMDLEETVAAIQAARWGVYRIDSGAGPDSFLALGISMGLGRPGLLLHRRGQAPPTDLKGLGALTFQAYTDLAQALAGPLDRLRRRYG